MERDNLVMSYLLISELVKAGENSLDSQNYWSALALALMLPSVCSRLEFEDNGEYFSVSRKDGCRKWYDKKAYVDWCSKYLFKPGYLSYVFGKEGSEILYILRCDMVHAGHADVYYKGRRVYLSVGSKGTGSTMFNDRVIIGVATLCRHIFDEVNVWCRNFGADHFNYTFVFDMCDHDDKLLYDSLCDEERTKLLRKQFALYEQRQIDSGNP